jgi:hypothetical protein
MLVASVGRRDPLDPRRPGSAWKDLGTEQEEEAKVGGHPDLWLTTLFSVL